MSREEIEQYDEEIHSLKYHRQEVIDLMQSQCDHNADDLVDVDYTHAGVWTNAGPGFRVCKACGYAEEDWGSGYWRLKCREEIPVISREKAHRDYVLTFVTQEELSKLRYKR